MHPFQILDEGTFVDTREHLHSVAKVFGRIRETLVKPTAKNENLWLEVYENGFQIPVMEQYGGLLVRCNLTKLRVEAKNSKFVYTVDLEDNSVSGLTEELLKILNELKIDFKADRIRSGTDGKIKLERENAGKFMVQLVNYNALIRIFKSGIEGGTISKLCLWPEHFDNAFVWYSGRKVAGADEQIGVGVSNGDEEIHLPYIYINPWPIPLGIDKIEVPEGAYFHSKGWAGFVLPYEKVSHKDGYEQQKELIDNFFLSTFDKINKEFKKR